MKNIILIGMPGCGKTTIGIELSKRLGLSFFDCDAEIIRAQGKPVSQIFEEYGEQYFRHLESETIQKLPTNDYVISTGGGAVEKSENIDALRKNGTVVFINRPVDRISEDIDTSNRPLLKNDASKLAALYERRINLYKSACHIEIENIGTFDDILQKIINEVKING